MDAPTVADSSIGRTGTRGRTDRSPNSTDARHGSPVVSQGQKACAGAVAGAGVALGGAEACTQIAQPPKHRGRPIQGLTGLSNSVLRRALSLSSYAISAASVACRRSLGTGWAKPLPAAAWAVRGACVLVVGGGLPNAPLRTPRGPPASPDSSSPSYIAGREGTATPKAASGWTTTTEARPGSLGGGDCWEPARAQPTKKRSTHI